MKTLLTGFLALAAIAGLFSRSQAADAVYLEAESFADRGGWKLDTQFIHIMGSPYLIAHGLGKPVADATTTVTFPGTGTYHVFVRTKDWVAPWKAPGQPGRFQVLVDGHPLEETFGTRNAEWFWHPGGTVEITRRQVTLALHDLTGFDGRCDALLFTRDRGYAPPNSNEPLAAWRQELLSLPAKPREAGPFDLVVIGGGYAGIASAVSAARLGCLVALIQDRPVLGGNGSSEIRVWANGLTRRGLFPHLGEIVEEFTDRASASPGPYEEFGDALKERIVRAEPNITLYLNHHAYQVETGDQRIQAVVALNTQTSEEVRFTAPLFADCTGHGTIGFLAGADYRMKEKGHLGMSNMWRWEETGSLQRFPETPWALDLTMKDFPYPVRHHGQWFWEGGFDLDPIRDLELIRDWNLRAVFGAFNAMKNGDGKEEHRSARLAWVAYIGGNRESRLLNGEVILTREDIVNKRQFDDGCVPTTWDIDLHYPEEKYLGKYADNPFIAYAHFDKRVDKKNGYPVPYRCFYSRNIENLFMAGRNVSVTHEALGTVRVMRTGGMMGEVVGKAAALCIEHDCLPRDIYHCQLEPLKELMRQPGAARRSEIGGQTFVPDDAPRFLPPGVEFVDPDSLPGIVVDDVNAEFEGPWTIGEGLQGYVGDHYRYLSASSPGTAKFRFQIDETGRYEVRLAQQPHANRSTRTQVTIIGGSTRETIYVNQRRAPDLENGFVSLGTYTWAKRATVTVIVSSEGSDGFVHVDAIQVLQVDKE